MEHTNHQKANTTWYIYIVKEDDLFKLEKVYTVQLQWTMNVRKWQNKIICYRLGYAIVSFFVSNPVDTSSNIVLINYNKINKWHDKTIYQIVFSLAVGIYVKYSQKVHITVQQFIENLIPVGKIAVFVSTAEITVTFLA